MQLPSNFAHRRRRRRPGGPGLLDLSRREPGEYHHRQGTLRPGEGEFHAHAWHLRRPERTIFATDDGQSHGAPVHSDADRTMGTLNVPSDTGGHGKTTGSIQCARSIRPTNIAIGSRGDIYISDGLRQRACAHVLADRPAEALLGRARKMVRASSACRMGSPARPTVGSSCATARSIGSDLQLIDGPTPAPDALDLRCHGQCLCHRARLACR